MTPVSPPASPNFQPRRAEWLALFGVLALMFIFNLWTYNLYPTAWCDEVLWSEPAINLIKTGHFTTRVWQLQPADTFWAAQSPLYCFLLAGWLPAAGTTLLAVRSFNFFLISVAVFLVWFASWRYRLISRGSYRLLIAPLLLLGYGLTFSYRCSRPDILGMISLVLFGLVFSIKSPRERSAALFLTATLGPWVGVQIALYIFLASLAAKLFYREVKFKDVALIWMGLGVGTGSMLLTYYLNGVLPNFMGTIFQAANEHMHWGRKATFLETVPRRIRQAFDAFLDFSALPLLFGLAASWIWFRGRPTGANRRAIAFLLVLYAALPFAFSFTGHFSFYYSYMVFVPLVLVFLHAFDSLARTGETGKSMVRIIFSGAAVGAMLLGLPLRLALTTCFCHIVPRSDYVKIIQSALRPDDVVLAHETAFFEAKQVAQKVYSPMYAKHLLNLTPAAHDFTPEEKAGLTVLIIWQHQFDFIHEYVGGDWVAVTEPFGDSFDPGNSFNLPLIGRRLQSHFGSPQLERFPLQVYRKKNKILAQEPPLLLPKGASR